MMVIKINDNLGLIGTKFRTLLCHLIFIITFIVFKSRIRIMQLSNLFKFLVSAQLELYAKYV